MSLCKNKLHQSQSTEIIGKVLDINGIYFSKQIFLCTNYFLSVPHINNVPIDKMT